MDVKLGVGLLVLLGLVVPRAAADVQTKYFEIGRPLVLKPKFSGTITGITWKHEGNIVAEWFKDLVPLEYLGDLKGRTELNLTTGTLTVSDMEKSDDGLFTVEINNRVLPDGFKAVGVNRLDPFHLEILEQPLACGSTANCTLVCVGAFRDAGTIQYFWKFGEKGEWKEDENKIVISRAETAGIQRFTCKAKNPVSEKVSAPIDNPFITEAKNTDVGQVVWIIIVIAVIGIAIIVIAIIAYKKPEVLPQKVQDRLPWVRRDAGADSGGQTANGKDPEGPGSAETVPMKSAPDSEDKS